MKPLFELPQLLTLDGEMIDPLAPERSFEGCNGGGGACDMGCGAGCAGGCDTGLGHGS